MYGLLHVTPDSKKMCIPYCCDIFACIILSVPLLPVSLLPCSIWGYTYFLQKLHMKYMPYSDQERQKFQNSFLTRNALKHDTLFVCTNLQHCLYNYGNIPQPLPAKCNLCLPGLWCCGHKEILVQPGQVTRGNKSDFQRTSKGSPSFGKPPINFVPRALHVKHPRVWVRDWPAIHSADSARLRRGEFVWAVFLCLVRGVLKTTKDVRNHAGLDRTVQELPCLDIGAVRAADCAAERTSQWSTRVCCVPYAAVRSSPGLSWWVERTSPCVMKTQGPVVLNFRLLGYLRSRPEEWKEVPSLVLATGNWLSKIRVSHCLCGRLYTVRSVFVPFVGTVLIWFWGLYCPIANLVIPTTCKIKYDFFLVHSCIHLRIWKIIHKTALPEVWLIT